MSIITGIPDVIVKSYDWLTRGHFDFRKIVAEATVGYGDAQAMFDDKRMEIEMGDLGSGTHAALLWAKSTTGLPYKLSINTKANGGVIIPLEVAHEHAHWKQAKNDPDRNSVLNMDPSHNHTLQKFKEDEAYGEGDYKAVIDLVNGDRVLEEFTDAYLDNQSAHFYTFLEVYTEAEENITTPLQARQTLEKIIVEKRIEPREKILPEFYYQLSFNTNLMNQITDNTNFFLHKNLLNTKIYGLERVKEEMSRPDLLGSHTFFIDNAEEMLKRNSGLDMVAALGPQKWHTLWQNAAQTTSRQEELIKIGIKEFEGFRRA